MRERVAAIHWQVDAQRLARRFLSLFHIKAQAFDLQFQPLFARMDFVRHPQEDTRQLTNAIRARSHLIEARRIKRVRFDRCGRITHARHLSQILHLFVTPTLLRQARIDARFQQHRVERFGQIVRRAQLDAPHHTVEFVERRNHDDGNIAQTRIVLQLLQGRVTVELGHQHVEQHEIECLGVQPGQRFLSVLRKRDLMPLLLQSAPQHHAIYFVVIYDQDVTCFNLHRATSLLYSMEIPFNTKTRRFHEATKNNFFVTFVLLSV